MVGDHGVLLALPVQALVRLLILFQTPREAKPDDVMSAGLQVQAIRTAGGVGQKNVYFSGIPRRFIVRPFVDPDAHAGPFQRLQNAVAVMSGDELRATIESTQIKFSLFASNKAETLFDKISELNSRPQLTDNERIEFDELHIQLIKQMRKDLNIDK